MNEIKPIHHKMIKNQDKVFKHKMSIPNETTEEIPIDLQKSSTVSLANSLLIKSNHTSKIWNLNNNKSEIRNSIRSNRSKAVYENAIVAS